MQAEYRYDAWGVCTIVSSSNNIAELNPFRYRGYYYDSETKLYYLNSRYYNPEVGRFVNADTINSSIKGTHSINGLNQYFYSANNPIMCTDDMGNWPKWLTKTLQIAAIVLVAAVAITAVVATAGAASAAVGFVVGGYLGATIGTVAAVATTAAAVAVVAGIAACAVIDTVSVITERNIGNELLGDVYDYVKAGLYIASALFPMAAQFAPPKYESSSSTTSNPSWTTERRNYWKGEASSNAGNYSSDNLGRMQQGTAPIGSDGYSMVLHHPEGRAGANFYNYVPMTRTEHIAFHQANGYHYYDGVWNFVRKILGG